MYNWQQKARTNIVNWWALNIFIQVNLTFKLEVQVTGRRLPYSSTSYLVDKPGAGPPRPRRAHICPVTNTA